MHTRFSWAGSIATALVVLLLGSPAGAAEPAPLQPLRFKPSRKDLAAFYKPLVLDGTSWYARVGAARWKGQRLQRIDRHERLILQLRVLGPLDGAT